MKKSMIILGAIFFASCMMISCDNASKANNQTNKLTEQKLHSLQMSKYERHNFNFDRHLIQTRKKN
jgi:preprotein translocase subunit SecG